MTVIDIRLAIAVTAAYGRYAQGAERDLIPAKLGTARSARHRRLPRRYYIIDE
jgi:hypothetical protein